MKTRKWLSPVWLHRYVIALKETLDVSADQKADMLEFLFEEGFWDRSKLTFQAAVSKFNACLNPERQEFFKTAEILALMKRFDRHAFFLAIAADLGYEVTRIPAEERRLRALERIADALEERNALVAHADAQVDDAFSSLRQVETAGPKERIHPALREQGANFSLDVERDGSEAGGF